MLEQGGNGIRGIQTASLYKKQLNRTVLYKGLASHVLYPSLCFLRLQVSRTQHVLLGAEKQCQSLTNLASNCFCRRRRKSKTLVLLYPQEKTYFWTKLVQCTFEQSKIVILTNSTAQSVERSTCAASALHQVVWKHQAIHYLIYKGQCKATGTAFCTEENTKTTKWVKR